MSLNSLRERLIERLTPAGAWTPDGLPDRSDYDLNPDAPRSPRTLRPAAVLVPVIARPEGASVLLTRRSDTLASHTGQIAFPGGRLDPGETAVQAALREAREEVALDPASVEVLGVGDGYETVTGFLVTPVIGWLAEPPVVSPSPDEVAEVFEAPWDFLMDPANHRRDFLEPESGPRRWFWAMPWRERYIWGATASILRALHARLYGDEARPGAAVGEDAA
ncbi:8-oxo-dGTP pyrophosphatase MutT (NUDIX family) [Brevundimonas alba]|uniref:8-oxo-dGTP pyrophosphatase MutT (NUDIX family) n=1 Tax=Brevundimonas alba TaxID=74314 RepID=A0A7X5YHC6_9CAUL|nr:CoA pyrophosphatase [Brevundimonas alba]NJC39990.1 8-oxo-dGTP pyrophosphatase MutT (NUDIX family) [Brevundimonas alba]